MSRFAGQTAVITGAASGIGRALAVELAARGAHVAISDIDMNGLALTAQLCGGDVRGDRLDVTDADGMLAYADSFDRVHLVINNAGIAFTGDVTELTLNDLHRVMDVDFWGVVHGTKAFLPHLIASGDGNLVNISSLFGLLAVPSQSAYHAAKFAVRGFTEALRTEMLAAGQPVRVTCVHPGGVRTAIARNAGAVASRDHAELVDFFDRRLAKVSSERAAQVILRGIEAGRPRVLVGADAKILDLLVRVAGARYQRLVAMAARRSAPSARPTSERTS